jgi:methyltransferase (TIGR00027 family)
MRAVYARTAQHPILHDPWGEILLPGAVIEIIQQQMLSALSQTSALADTDDDLGKLDAAVLSHPALANVIVRSRYTEDALEAALSGGVKQYVLIGAGFDSYALRIPASARQISIYEIDHPATQQLKMQRLKECELSVPETVHFLPADLGEKRLSEVLSSSSFKAYEPAFFCLLGVTMYLSHYDNMTTLGEIASSAAPGSELVFTYMDQAAFTPAETAESRVFSDLQQSVTAVGEPFISGFDPATLARELRQVGLQLEEDLTDDQAIERYDKDRSSGLRSAPQSRIARATVLDSKL